MLKLPRTRMIDPVKSTSRQWSAINSPSRRPVNDVVRKIAASCSEAAARTSGPNFLRGEDLDVTAGPLRMLLDPRQWIHVDVVDHLGAAEDAVQFDQQLVLGPR